jgi:hypothetical protein
MANPVANPEDQRVARTEALFRDVNERIAETAGRFLSEDAFFVCECADAECTERVTATLDEYESVRGDGAQFLLSNGHELQEAERVVERHRRFNVVRKVKPAIRRIVERLNPRKRPL